MKTVGAGAILAPVTIAVAVVVALVLSVVGVAWPIAIVAAVVFGAAAAAMLYLRSEGAVVGRVRLRVVDEIDEPRLHNMVDGLCDSHGFRRPVLAVIDDDALNAVVYGRSPDRITLAVTSGLIHGLHRVELEGLLARELALANHDGLPATTVLVSILAIVPTGVRARVLAWFLGAHRAVLDDFGAVRFTRYPPGLAAALDALARGSTVVAGASRASRHLWVATPTAGELAGPDNPTIDERVAALREL